MDNHFGGCLEVRTVDKPRLVRGMCGAIRGSVTESFRLCAKACAAVSCPLTPLSVSESDFAMSNFESRRRMRRGPGVPPKLRQQALRRDKRVCQLQLEPCTVTATEVDHIVAVSEGGKDELSNLQAVCAECHKIKTQAEAQRARARHSRKRPPMKHPGQFNPFDPVDQAKRRKARELLGYPPDDG